MYTYNEYDSVSRLNAYISELKNAVFMADDHCLCQWIELCNGKIGIWRNEIFQLEMTVGGTSC